jgi:hypothetical protein
VAFRLLPLGALIIYICAACINQMAERIAGIALLVALVVWELYAQWRRPA